MFNPSELPNPFATDGEGEAHRLIRLTYGAASPMWVPFLMAASAGAAFWMASGWMRGGHAATLPAVVPPAEPDAPTLVERAETVMAHTPPPAEAGHDTIAPAPAPVEPAQHLMEHAPEASVDMPGDPAIERRYENARAFDEAGGEAALLAQTASAMVGEIGGFGGDARAEETAEPTSVAFDDESVLLDAQYAQNLGPVPMSADEADLETDVDTDAARKPSRRRKTGIATGPGL